MPKRPSVERDSGCTAKPRRKHLYLVLDDWALGYSIRKVDLASDSDSDDNAEPPQVLSGEGTWERLPPAVVRLNVRPGMPENFAAAFDTKIIALHPAMVGDDSGPFDNTRVAPIFDVRTRSLTFCPRPTVELYDPIYFPVGKRLFALDDDSFQVLFPPPVGADPSQYSWTELQKPPFKRGDVTSYALHSDGRTFFVSTMKEGTFTFVTEWKHHGAWVLPFNGRAHFDCEMNAWIGLSGNPSATGYLCSLEVPSKSDGQLPPKLSKEMLFSEDPVERHVGATLVHMGGKSSKFCLLQCVSIGDDGLSEDDYWDQCILLLRLTTFSLKFDMHGDLTTGNSCRVRCYKLSAQVCAFAMNNPVGFWM